MDIANEIGIEALLGQLAEECCELGKAVLKLQRIIHGTNPTPVTEEEARASILEEATDVQDCVELLRGAGFLVHDERQSEEKKYRWKKRIRDSKTPKYYTGKVVCVETHGVDWVTVGKIYEVKNGEWTNDDGYIFDESGRLLNMDGVWITKNCAGNELVFIKIKEDDKNA